MLELERRLAKFGMRLGLERMEQICGALGRPQDRMKVILVTGTNGKGSVTAALASILASAGYRTGSYFSPHVVRWNERIKVDGQEIGNAEFASYEQKLLGMHDAGQEMTLFEALTAIAYRYFADKNCDYVVMEIGMGGRYDATNIALEEAAVITNVELEHTEHLGKTIGAIALEKACTIKNPRGFAVTGCTGAALEEVRARAEEVRREGGSLLVLGKDFSVSVQEAKMDGTAFDYVHGPNRYGRLFIPLAGKHQVVNAALAIAVAERLGVGERAIRKGLARTAHPGRLQIVERGTRKKPLVVIDGAHNPAGMKALVESLGIYPRKKLVCVFTALRDKDWRPMIAMLAPWCERMIINQLSEDRAEKAETMAEEAAKYTKATVVEDIGESVRVAENEAGEGGMVLVCGSLYMLGEALKAVERK
jgi:dihydrofolate synthase/folylpolyglutamate synthase